MSVDGERKVQRKSGLVRGHRNDDVIDDVTDDVIDYTGQQ